MQADADDDSSEEPSVEDEERQACDPFDKCRNRVLGSSHRPGEHAGHPSEEADDQHDPQCHNQRAVDVTVEPAEAARCSDAADGQKRCVEDGCHCQQIDQNGQYRSAEHQQDQPEIFALPRVPSLSQQCQEQESEYDGNADPEQRNSCVEGVVHDC